MNGWPKPAVEPAVTLAPAWLLVVIAVCGTLGLALPVNARRVPGAGGTLVVALPDAMIEATVEAHVFFPILNRLDSRPRRAQLAHPALPGLPGWGSAVLSALEPEDDAATWLLTTLGPAKILGDSVKSCFGIGTAGDWPARALEAASVRVAVETGKRSVRLSFDRSVGPLPELLAGCLVRGPTGPYARSGRLRLDAREGHPLGPPAIARIEFRRLGEPADLVAGSPIAPGVAALLAPFPDVLLLLQPKSLREQDPLELVEETPGFRSFHSDLRADLLVAIFWAGRGGPALGILPPGLAPARPLPEPSMATSTLPLTLGALASAAQRIRILHPPSDALVDGVVERIAVLLRTRGFGTEATPSALSDGPADKNEDHALQLLRWRPPTMDPALALLVLAGEHPVLRTGFELDLSAVGLLSTRMENRLEAAMALERRWTAERAVVPLLTAERWFAFDPDLGGARVRADGVPLLDGAYWGGVR